MNTFNRIVITIFTDKDSYRPINPHEIDILVTLQEVVGATV